MQYYEIVLYQPNDAIHLEVRMEKETVWLNRNQMAVLFGRDVKTIGKYINNALQEELQDIATVVKFAIIQNEDNRRVTRLVEFSTQQPSAPLQLDIQRHDSQYIPLPIHTLTRSHDRFFLVDNDVYHVGASIKNLGKRWFAIMKMQETKADEIIEHF